MSTPATRRSERKRAVNTRIADLSSPTQRAPPPSKKRKANNQAPPRPRPRPRPSPSPRQKTPEQEPAETLEDSDDETAAEDDEIPRDADLVIPHLAVSRDPILVVETCGNDKIEAKYGNDSVTAFAKICGRDWTYYVQDTMIYFGREQVREEGDGDIHPINIDLGPNKVVSRVHAVVSYRQEAWFIEVCGRNGVKLDNEDIRKGETKPIHSGTVIAIAGTEMLLQIPNVKTDIAQMYKDRVVRYDEELNDGGFHGDLDNVQHPIRYYPVGGPLYAGAGPFSPYPPMGPAFPGHQNIAPAPLEVARPVTPTKQVAAGPAKRRSPNNRRATDGIMMESTEQIDYSAESSKDIKPACSYAAMITWAILSTEERCMALAEIYAWVMVHYAYYRHISPTGWQNSIRHNLSLNQAFIKTPRRPDEPGKGMKWKLDPRFLETTLALANKNASKGGGRVSSAPGTPAGGAVTLGGFPPAPHNGNVKTSPTSRTPPLSSYPPTQQQAYTPTRGPQMPAPAYTPRMPAYAPTQGTLPVLSDETSPMPKRRTNGKLNAMDSSPTLTSGAWPHDAPLRTPAPRPHNLSVPQPNTARLPTSHLADSSPAPFWTYDNNGSTPLRPWPEISPVKSKGNSGAPDFQSSSPPPVANAVESPTRKPRPPIFSATQIGNARADDDEGGIDITRQVIKFELDSKG